jgi:hypothetical protein
MTQKIFLSLILAATVLAQGPSAPTDPQILTTLKTRHRPTGGAAFEFAAIGDQQYGPVGEAKWPALVTDINASGVQFVVHVGDVKSGSTLCSNDMFLNRVQSFNAFAMPMILTPGDNEWTDCHRANNGSFDPLERLAYLRSVFYPSNQSFGQRKATLSQQSEDARYRRYVENSMWSQGNVLFAALHVVGSNNNLGRNAANDAEWRERTDANFNWLKTIYAVARENQFAALVLIMQANPGFEGQRYLADQLETGFRETFFVIEDETIVYQKPVLAIIGDSHLFRIDQPLIGRTTRQPLGNFFRLEVPGSADVHWVRVRVDPASRSVFSFSPEMVPANLQPQQRP